MRLIAFRHLLSWPICTALKGVRERWPVAWRKRFVRQALVERYLKCPGCYDAKRRAA